MCKNKLYLVRKSGDDWNHNKKTLGQEDYEFEVSPGYIVRPYLNIQKRNTHIITLCMNLSVTAYTCLYINTKLHAPITPVNVCYVYHSSRVYTYLYTHVHICCASNSM